jgi:hypothetical protein
VGALLTHASLKGPLQGNASRFPTSQECGRGRAEPTPLPERQMNGGFGRGSEALAYTFAHRIGRSRSSLPTVPDLRPAIVPPPSDAGSRLAGGVQRWTPPAWLFGGRMCSSTTVKSHSLSPPASAEGAREGGPVNTGGWKMGAGIVVRATRHPESAATQFDFLPVSRKPRPWRDYRGNGRCVLGPLPSPGSSRARRG